MHGQQLPKNKPPASLVIFMGQELVQQMSHDTTCQGNMRIVRF